MLFELDDQSIYDSLVRTLLGHDGIDLRPVLQFDIVNKLLQIFDCDLDIFVVIVLLFKFFKLMVGELTHRTIQFTPFIHGICC